MRIARQSVGQYLHDKIGSIIRHRFRGDISAFILGLNTALYRQILADRPEGMSILELPTNRFDLVGCYFRAAGIYDQWSALRPYHFAYAAPNTFADERLRDEVIVKKIDWLLAGAKFDGKLGRLIAELQWKDFLSNFTEEIGGYEFKVTPGSIGSYYRNSVFLVLTRYLEVKGLAEEWRGLRPYHMAKPSAGTYHDPATCDEVLVKKIDDLLCREYGGSVRQLIVNIGYEQLRRPFTEEIAGQVFTVAMRQVLEHFSHTVFNMVWRYLELKGLATEWAGLRPYHLRNTTRGYGKTPEVIDELLKKKFDLMLAAPPVSGSIGCLVEKLNYEETAASIVEQIAGHEFKISMNSVLETFQHNLYSMLMHYISITDRSDEWGTVKPYHLSQTTRGYYEQEGSVDELLTRKIDSILPLPPFNGRIELLIQNVSFEWLSGALEETIGNHTFRVSMKSVAFHRFGGSTFALLWRYLELKGLAETWRDLRPYHLAEATRGSASNDTLVDELIRKKFDALVAECGGTLGSLIASYTSLMLEAPLIDEVAGHKFEVSTSLAINRYGDMFSVLWRYIQLCGLEETWSGLRPYHLPRATAGTFDDAETLQEFWLKKLNFMLEGCQGNFELLLATVNLRNLNQPFTDVVNGQMFEVRAQRALVSAGGTCVSVLRRYCKAQGIPFPYSEECFRGPASARLRRIRGEFSSFDLGRIRQDDGSYETSRYGLPQFNSEEKAIVRHLALQDASYALGDVAVRYLGLETEQFESLRLLFREYGSELRPSVVVERSMRVYNAMQAISRVDGSLPPVHIVPGDLRKVLTGNGVRQFADMGPFNFFNLDFVGPYGKDKEIILQALCDSGLVGPRAVILITVADNERFRARLRRHGYSDDQAMCFDRVVEKLAGTRWTMQRLFDLSYTGGTNGRRGTRMLILGYLLSA